MARKRNRNRQTPLTATSDIPSDTIEELEDDLEGVDENDEEEETMTENEVEAAVEEIIPAKPKPLPTSRFTRIKNITNNTIELFNAEGQCIQILAGATNRVPTSFINETDSFLYRIVD